MFENNPCRQTLFDVFQIDKSSTDLRDIRRRVRDTRDVWAHEKHSVKGVDGVVFPLEEARLNELEKRLFDPLERLKEEQFVHQAHPFADDAELAAAIAHVQEPVVQAVKAADTRAVVTGVLGALLPQVSASKLPDDLPQPEKPTPFPIEPEPLEKAIQRDA